MDFLQDTSDYFSSYVVQIAVSIGLVMLYIAVRRIVAKLIRRQIAKEVFDQERELYTKKLINVLLTIGLLLLVGATWEISLKGLSIYFVSIFTVVGVGLFASWSMLSNVTASIILFFFYPYRVGGAIKIIDGDNSVEGVILDISLFNIRIKTSDGRTVTYPNNLAIQKPISDIVD